MHGDDRFHTRRRSRSRRASRIDDQLCHGCLGHPVDGSVEKHAVFCCSINERRKVEKTNAPIEPSSRCIVQAYKPLDQSHPAKLKPRSAFPAPGLHGLGRIRVKKGLLETDFAALQGSS